MSDAAHDAHRDAAGGLQSSAVTPPQPSEKPTTLPPVVVQSSVPPIVPPLDFSRLRRAQQPSVAAAAKVVKVTPADRIIERALADRASTNGDPSSSLALAVKVGGAGAVNEALQALVAENEINGLRAVLFELPRDQLDVSAPGSAIAFALRAADTAEAPEAMKRAILLAAKKQKPSGPEAAVPPALLLPTAPPLRAVKPVAVPPQNPIVVPAQPPVHARQGSLQSPEKPRPAAAAPVAAVPGMGAGSPGARRSKPKGLVICPPDVMAAAKKVAVAPNPNKGPGPTLSRTLDDSSAGPQDDVWAGHWTRGDDPIVGGHEEGSRRLGSKLFPAIVQTAEGGDDGGENVVVEEIQLPAESSEQQAAALKMEIAVHCRAGRACAAHVVKCFGYQMEDYATADGDRMRTFYIFRERCGVSLQAQLDAGIVFAVFEVRKFAVCLLKALRVLHAIGGAHLNVQPTTVFFAKGSSGPVKLGCFRRALRGSREDKALVLPPLSSDDDECDHEFRAPELAAGSANDLLSLQAADVYALGKVLLRCLPATEAGEVGDELAASFREFCYRAQTDRPPASRLLRHPFLKA